MPDRQAQPLPDPRRQPRRAVISHGSYCPAGDNRASFDLMAEVVCAGDDQLLEIHSQVRSMPGVTTTETFVYLKPCKQTFHTGT
jgi:DNA-binding Lrp family transcriptional regulator